MPGQKKWEELEISDDFMFAKVMRDAELCREMLERLLGIQISKIEYPEEQKTIDISYDSRSVRLDLYVKDEENTVYNVEIQTVDTKELPKRSRYYQGMIDLNLIEKGEHYSRLNTSYVIFICTFDLFGKGYYQYSFENICREDSDIRLDDQAVKIFFNTSGNKGNLSEEAKAFLKYVGGTLSDDAFVQKLENKVTTVRENEEWRREYMTLLMRDQENREIGRQEGIKQGLQQGLLQGQQKGIKEGIKEGRKEGIKEGRQEATTQIVRMLLRNGVLSDAEIISVADISAEELQAMKETLDM